MKAKILTQKVGSQVLRWTSIKRVMGWVVTGRTMKPTSLSNAKRIAILLDKKQKEKK